MSTFIPLYPPLSRFIPARTFQVHVARGRDDSPQPQVIGQQDRRLPRRLPYQRRQGGVRSPHKSHPLEAPAAAQLLRVDPHPLAPPLEVFEQLEAVASHQKFLPNLWCVVKIVLLEFTQLRQTHQPVVGGLPLA